MKKTKLTRTIAGSDFGARVSDFTPGRARFRFDNPEVDEVFVAGTFNNWNPTSTRLTLVGHGLWVTELLLPPGRYEYQFVADGRWLPDPSRELVLDPLGELNSVLVIPQHENGKARAPQIIRKWKWYYVKLVNLRERLLKDRRERMHDVTDPLQTHGINFAESATDELDHDLALGELSATQDALYEVEEALNRIVEGNYGKCEMTGKPISVQRLRAVPWTRFCAQVEAQIESQGVLSRRSLGYLRSVHAPEDYYQKQGVNQENQDGTGVSDFQTR